VSYGGHGASARGARLREVPKKIPQPSVEDNDNSVFFETMVSPEDDHFIDKINGLGEEVSVLLQGRNVTLYSDIFSDGTVFSPNDVTPKKMASDALDWAKGRLAMAEALIKPILESDVLRTKDDELKKKYDEFMTTMEDPERREELRKKLMSE